MVCHQGLKLPSLQPYDAYENMVKEIYVNAISKGEELKCWVRGKSFSVTPVYLAEILHINQPIFTNLPVELNSDEEVLPEALGDNLEFSFNKKSVSVASLSPKLRLLTMIMFSNLYPLSSTGYMNLGRALFLHDLISDEEIDVCSHIFHILAKTVDRTASRNCLPFCRLISRILKLKGVHSLVDVLRLVPLNPIVWCYVWYYVWHDVWLNIVINKVVFIIIWNNGNMNIWTLSYSPWDA